MKRTGPPKKPTQLKVIEGTFRKDRARAKERKPDVAIPTALPHVSEEAKLEWERISAELAKLGLLSQIDRAALPALRMLGRLGQRLEAEISPTLRPSSS